MMDSSDFSSHNAGSSFEVLSQQGKIAVASSVTVFVVTFILHHWFSVQTPLSQREENSWDCFSY